MLPIVVDERALPKRDRRRPWPSERALVLRFGEERGHRLARVAMTLVHDELVVHGPFAWLEGNEAGGGGWRLQRWRFTMAGDEIVRFAGVDGLSLFLAETLADVQQNQAHILGLCDENDQRVLRHMPDVLRLTRALPGRTTTLDPALIGQWEPPNCDGRTLRFVVDGEVDLLRVVVDVETLAVELQPLGPTAQRTPIDNEWEPPPVIEGRAYVDDRGVNVVAPARAVPASSRASSPVAASSAAASWVTQAQGEHASIASFARLTLELMAVGAPLSLLARVQAAALDEVRHTAQCCALAARDGVDVDFGPLPALAPRDGDRFAIAQRTRDEAVVEESAAIVRMRARLAGLDDEARAVVEAQIVDEERHVQLARDIIAWCWSGDARA